MYYGIFEETHTDSNRTEDSNVITPRTVYDPPASQIDLSISHKDVYKCKNIHVRAPEVNQRVSHGKQAITHVRQNQFQIFMKSGDCFAKFRAFAKNLGSHKQKDQNSG